MRRTIGKRTESLLAIAAAKPRPTSCEPLSCITEPSLTIYSEVTMKNLDESPRREEGRGEPVPIQKRDAQPQPQPQPEAPQSLLLKQQVDEFRQRWSAIQTAFIDEPRRSVKDA